MRKSAKLCRGLTGSGPWLGAAVQAGVRNGKEMCRWCMTLSCTELSSARLVALLVRADHHLRGQPIKGGSQWHRRGAFFLTMSRRTCSHSVLQRLVLFCPSVPGHAACSSSIAHLHHQLQRHHVGAQPQRQQHRFSNVRRLYAALWDQPVVVQDLSTKCKCKCGGCSFFQTEKQLCE